MWGSTRHRVGIDGADNAVPPRIFVRRHELKDERNRFVFFWHSHSPIDYSEIGHVGHPPIVLVVNGR